MSRLRPFLLWVLDSHQNNFVQNRLGFFDDNSYEAQWVRISRMYFNEPAIKWLSRNVSEYRPDFIEEFRDRLAKSNPELVASLNKAR